jgi:hypothetical protein
MGARLGILAVNIVLLSIVYAFVRFFCTIWETCPPYTSSLGSVRAELVGARSQDPLGSNHVLVALTGMCFVSSATAKTIG